MPADTDVSTAIGCACENPPRRVWVSGFEIDRLEATAAGYRTCVKAGKCTALTSWHYTTDPADANDPRAVHQRDTSAVIATFEQGRDYCVAQGKRLPTEAEWEKAARGSDRRIYPWGNASPTCETASIAIPESRCFPTIPGAVGAHPRDRSPLGVLDMAGNVPEWTSDFAAGRITYELGSACPSLEKSAPVTFIDSATMDPKGPTERQRESWIRSQWPSDADVAVRDEYPLHVARTGSIAVRNVQGLTDGTLPKPMHLAGIRCVRDIKVGALASPDEAMQSITYEVSLRRDPHNNNYVIDSKPMR